LQPPFARANGSQKSQPMVWLRKGNGQRGGRDDKNYGEGEYDELMQFYAAFLTAAMPATSPSQPGVTLARQTSGRSTVMRRRVDPCWSPIHTPIPVGSVMVPDARIQVSVLKPALSCLNPTRNRILKIRRSWVVATPLPPEGDE